MIQAIKRLGIRVASSPISQERRRLSKRGISIYNCCYGCRMDMAVALFSSIEGGCCTSQFHREGARGDQVQSAAAGGRV